MRGVPHLVSGRTRRSHEAGSGGDVAHLVDQPRRRACAYALSGLLVLLDGEEAHDRLQSSDYAVNDRD